MPAPGICALQMESVRLTQLTTPSTAYVKKDLLGSIVRRVRLFYTLTIFQFIKHLRKKIVQNRGLTKLTGFFKNQQK